MSTISGSGVAHVAGAGGVSAGAQISLSAAQAVASGSLSQILFNTTDRNTTPSFINVANPNVITIPTAGKYLILGHTRAQGGGAGYVEMVPKINSGSQVTETDDHGASAGSDDHCHVAFVRIFAVGDTVRLDYKQTSGFSADIYSAVLSVDLLP